MYLLFVTSNPFLGERINHTRLFLIQLFIHHSNALKDIEQKMRALYPDIDRIPIFVKVIPIIDRCDSSGQCGKLLCDSLCLLLYIVLQVAPHDLQRPLFTLRELPLRKVAILGREGTDSVGRSTPELLWHAADIAHRVGHGIGGRRRH